MRLFQRYFFVLLSVFSLSVNAFSFPGDVFELFEKDIQKNSGIDHGAKARLLAWHHLINANQSGSDWQKINRVNQFFNRITYREDIAQWGVDDYWASPQEFLNTNAGDCEDYSIAKYFTLKAMGVSINKLRITYVTTLPAQQAHMVLVYLEGKEQIPLVLDNLSDTILSITERRDLDPVYSFNNQHLWLVRDKWEVVEGGVQQVSAWQALTLKMQNQQIM